MSWKGVCKAIKRLPFRTKKKIGLVQCPRDPQIDEITLRVLLFSKTLLRVKELAQKTKDHFEELSTANLTLVVTACHLVSQFSRETPTEEDSLLSGERAKASAFSRAVKESGETIQHGVLKQIDPVRSCLENIKQRIQKRDRKLIDVERLAENTEHGGGTLEGEYNDALSEFEKHNRPLLEETPAVFERIEDILVMFCQILQKAESKMFSVYYTDAARCFDEIKQKWKDRMVFSHSFIEKHGLVKTPPAAHTARTGEREKQITDTRIECGAKGIVLKDTVLVTGETLFRGQTVKIQNRRSGRWVIKQFGVEREVPEESIALLSGIPDEKSLNTAPRP
ncbi:MAG: BAR-domain-containing protein [Amphiamblys sp. WSBS2006]|nr:MAG: BAR-domain-containing protein [Amphiamblys sp. WSBS2006]